MKEIKYSTVISLLIFCFLSIFSMNGQPQKDANLPSGLMLPSVLSDNMVLQQNSKVRLWGKCTPLANIKITTEWNRKVTMFQGNKEGDWEAIVETNSAGGPYAIDIESGKERLRLNNILLGEVWICSGQSNMEMPLKGWGKQVVANSSKTIEEADKYKDIRIYTAKKTISENKEFDVEGNWVIPTSDTAGNLTAVGYHYARILNDSLNVPIGMIHISWGGSNVQAWVSYENLKMFPEVNLKMDMASKTPQRIPTALYNGMFHPVRKYSIKGVIWYQGESNLREEKLYEKLFPAMVSEWRNNLSNENIPFYYVQITPHTYDGEGKTTSAFIREVQAKCMDLIPKSGMIVTMDAGAKGNIHPPNKEIIAERLANWAFAKTYGYENVHYLSPSFDKSEILNDKIKLTFKDVKNGLILKGEPNNYGFEIAGKDNVFFPAKAELINNKIIVSCPHVKSPLYVRYCFKNYIEGSLFDTEGLPVSSFRTDSLPE